ncbi:hypothetical protein DYB37_011236 [Aphanomyces astaci]|uniref:Uncharacterized protein n=1 Tax=Aphanomyces astaci TaxID=112090 RepID=A0A3R6YBZ0_APHAT|nr:hypothetical protein DYB37_011236 [Aphanomyces astaci]
MAEGHAPQPTRTIRRRKLGKEELVRGSCKYSVKGPRGAPSYHGDPHGRAKTFVGLSKGSYIASDKETTERYVYLTFRQVFNRNCVMSMHADPWNMAVPSFTGTRGGRNLGRYRASRGAMERIVERSVPRTTPATPALSTPLSLSELLELAAPDMVQLWHYCGCHPTDYDNDDASGCRVLWLRSILGVYHRAVLVPVWRHVNLNVVVLQTRGDDFAKQCTLDNLQYEVDTVERDGSVSTQVVQLAGVASLGVSAQKAAFFGRIPELTHLRYVGVGVTEAGIHPSSQAMKDLAAFLVALVEYFPGRTILVS